MKVYYTGVGSREISKEEYSILVDIGERMAQLGYILRSGGAEGSDSAFQEGACKINQELTEIWLPWEDFNIKLQQKYPKCNYEKFMSLYEYNVARKELLTTAIIPWFDTMGNRGAHLHPEGWIAPVKKLHARNYYQVVGKDSLSKVCIYAAPEEKGDVKGGTRSAVFLSRYYGIPTFNIRVKEQKETLLKKLKM